MKKIDSQPIFRNVYDSGLTMGWHHTLTATNSSVRSVWGERVGILMVFKGKAKILSADIDQQTLDQLIKDEK
jgi:hypothetical protein